jgi:hypothetical protein
MAGREMNTRGCTATHRARVDVRCTVRNCDTARFLRCCNVVMVRPDVVDRITIGGDVAGEAPLPAQGLR